MAKAIVETYEHARVDLALDSVVEERGFNDREEFGETKYLLIDDLLDSVVARGKVIQPITVFKRGTEYVVITGHRRVRVLRCIKDIKGGMAEEEAVRKYGITKVAFRNVLASEVVYASIPALIVPEESINARRLENFLSNTGKPYSRKEQGIAFSRMRKMNYREWMDWTGKPLPEGKKETNRIDDAHIAEMCGVTASHVSQCLAYIPQETDTEEKKAIKKLVHATEVATKKSPKPFNSNDGTSVIRHAKTVKEAEKMIADILLAKVEKATKGKKQKVEMEEEEEEVLLETEHKGVTPLPPVSKGQSTPEQIAAQKHADLAYLVGIFDRQGLVVVRDAAVRWANAKKPRQTVPWVNTADTDKQPDKAA